MSVRLRLITSSLSAWLTLLTVGFLLSFALFCVVAEPFLGERLRENLGPVAARYFPAAGILALILAGFGTLWMQGVSARHVVQPLKRLKRAAVEIRDGNLGYELMVSGRDEFTELSSCFEQMRIRLRDSTFAGQQAEAERNAMMAGICHDLKTPITSILGYAEGILDGVADTPEKLRDYASVIRKKAIALQKLADDLALLSKLENAQLPLDTTEADWGIFVKELAAEFAEENPELTLTGAANEGLLVRIDREKMARVLFNLMQNSVKYQKPDVPPVLALAFSRLGENALLTLTDNGMGVSPEDMPHVFDRFYRADASRGKQPGSGLGLSIAQQIVQLHGGKIWMAAGGGGGTTVSVTLPLAVRRDGKGEGHA